MKLFKDVQKGETVFMLQPDTLGRTFEATVKASIIHPKTKNKEVWVLEVYIPFKDDLVKAEALKEAEAFGTKTAKQFFVPSNASFVVVSTPPKPTIICTTKLEMDRFIATMTPDDSATFLKMKQSESSANPNRVKRPWH